MFTIGDARGQCLNECVSCLSFNFVATQRLHVFLIRHHCEHNSVVGIVSAESFCRNIFSRAVLSYYYHKNRVAVSLSAESRRRIMSTESCFRTLISRIASPYHCQQKRVVVYEMCRCIFRHRNLSRIIVSSTMMSYFHEKSRAFV